MPYFERLDERRFLATEEVSGAWDTAHQHIAPALGLLVHAVELDRDHRRTDRLHVGRLSYDILGVVPVDTVEVDVRVLRPGRTIELVEASLHHDGRTIVLLRAWLMRADDNRSVAGSPLFCSSLSACARTRTTSASWRLYLCAPRSPCAFSSSDA